MALDGLTMGFIVRELQDKLLGGRVDKVQQPEKDLVVLQVRGAGATHRLLVNANPTGTRLHLTTKTYENPEVAPVFTMLMRKHLAGGRITAIQQLGGDRLIRIDVTGSDEMGEQRVKELWFEAMGRHSNLSLVLEGRIIDCLRHVTDDMSRVRRMLPGAAFELPPAQDKLAPEALTADSLRARLLMEGGRADKALANVVAGLGAGTAKELCLRLTGQETPLLTALNLPLFAQQAEKLLHALPGMAAPTLLMGPEGLPQDVLPFRFLSHPLDSQQPRDSLSEALDELHYEKDRYTRLMQRTSAFRRTLQAAQERTLRKMALQEEELQGSQRMEEYRVAGELLTAYAHQVPKGAESVDLPNWYDGQPLTVALDPALSPAANAQRYFKRYRKAHTGRKLAAEQKEKSQQELQLIEDALYALEEARTLQDISEIKEPLREQGLIKREPAAKGKRRPQESLPLRFMAADGTEILVGRNSLQNERLLKLADGQDLWLHAKDMPGSHVIVRAQGREVGQDTLLLAARLAAWYSKGQGAAVPVNYTLRRHVKKPGGAPAGFVTFTNEKLLIASATPAELKPFGQEGP